MNAGHYRKLRFEALEERIALSVDVVWPGVFNIIAQQPDVAAMDRPNNQTETFIAVNPTLPGNLVVMANTGENSREAVAISFDGGTTGSWGRSDIGLLEDGLNDNDPVNRRFDGALAFDRFGNVHLTYMHRNPAGIHEIVHAISSDGGASYTAQVLLTNATNDKPWIATGPDFQDRSRDVVYITYSDNSDIYIQGAVISGPGVQNLGTFSPRVRVSDAWPANFAVPAVGPNGEVAVTWQQNFFTESTVSIFVDRDLNGLQNGLAFGTDITVTTSNAGSFDYIPATPERSHFATPYIAYDQTSSLNPLRNAVVNGKFGGAAAQGRLYLVYVHEPIDESNNNTILLRYSDNNGLTWSGPVRVDDTGGNGVNSRFFPNISVDQANGAVFVGWLDARNDAGIGGIDSDGIANTDVQYYGAVSTNGGLGFGTNRLISDPAGANDLGASNQARANPDPNDFGDYTGIAAHGGTAVGAWPDNSRIDPIRGDLDVYVDRMVLRGGAAANQIITLTGSVADDVYIVRLDPTEKFIQIYENLDLTAFPVPTYTATVSEVNRITINSGDGNDELEIDARLAFLLPGGVQYNGGAGTDLITAIGGSWVYTLTNTNIGMFDPVPAANANIPMTGVEEVVLDGSTGSVFNISGWTGTSVNNMLMSNGGTVIDTRDANFIFDNAELFSSAGANSSRFDLVGITTLQLTGGGSANSFTSNGWTGPGPSTLNGATGNDTLNATIDGNFTLSDALLIAGPATFNLSSIEAANLTGGPGDNRFDVSGWTRPGPNSLDGQGGNDTVIATANANFSLSNTQLVVGASTFALASIEFAELTGGAGNNSFTVANWTGGGTINGGAGADTFNIRSWGNAGTIIGGSGDDRVFIALGDIGAIAGLLTVAAGTGNDQMTINDAAYASLSDYEIVPTMIRLETDLGPPRPARPFVGIDYDGTLETLTIFGGSASNLFLATPSTDTAYAFYGGLHLIPNGGFTGDFLATNFFGTSGHTLTPSPFNPAVVSTWTFTSAHKTITFRQFEGANENDEFMVVGSEATLTSEPLVQVYNVTTGVLTAEFLAYDASFRGGVRVVARDFDADDIPEIVTAPGIGGEPVVKIFRADGTLLGSFNAYNSGMVGGIDIGVGDVTGDGRLEIVTVPTLGVVEVRVFAYNGVDFGTFGQIQGFQAYPDSFISGANITVGDLTGDGRADIVTAPGAGMEAKVSIFDGANPGLLLREVLVQPGNFSGHMSIAIADVKGRDGINELIVAAGRNGGSQVYVYSSVDYSLIHSFTAFTEPSNFAPLSIITRDINGDGAAEVIVGQGMDGRTNTIRIYRPVNSSLQVEFPIIEDVLQFGVNLG